MALSMVLKDKIATATAFVYHVIRWDLQRDIFKTDTFQAMFTV